MFDVYIYIQTAYSFIYSRSYEYISIGLNNMNRNGTREPFS